MTLFNILYLSEHISDKKIDAQLVILYDESDGNFYYYGKRAGRSNKNDVNYSGKFHFTKVNDFVNFISILVDGFIPRITTELHQIKISIEEYDKLNVDYLLNKISSNTELAAYDKFYETADNMYNYLQTLITHEE
jgi:hypothetical protein